MPQELKCVKCTKVDRSTRNVKSVLLQLSSAGGQDNSKSSHLLPDVKERRPLFAVRRDDKNKSTVDEFCQHVVKLPGHLLKEETVVSFFRDSSSPDEDGAIELVKAKDLKKTNKVGTTSKDNKDSLKSDSASSPSPSPTSPSPSPAAAAAVASRLTSLDATYAEIKDTALGDVGRPSFVIEYSEVKTKDAEDNAYAECAEPSGSNSSRNNHLETVELREKTCRPIHEDVLYASVFKPKTSLPTTTNPQPPTTTKTTGDEFYEDTSSVFAPLKREEDEPVLYEDATSTGAPYHNLQQQQQLRPPAPPRPRGASIPSESNSKVTSSPTKPVPSQSPSAAVSSSSVTPLTPIPPMPQFPSPTLSNPETLLNGASGGASDESGGGEIQVVAIGDYDSTSSSDNVLSFRRGTLATLLLQSDSDWWCIRLGTTHGWVPAAYWRMLNSGDCASLITRGNSPWFVGKLSRAECEALLTEHGKQQHFVVRESDSGHYALSIKYDDRIHHFPIEVTADKKYNIGKHDFKTVNNIILYYQKNALFYDDQDREVTLGSPLVIIKH